MATPSPSTDVHQLWDILTNEINGIQLIWGTLERLYSMQGQGLATLARNVPLFHGLMQTALVKSLLMRISRLMDDSTSGKSKNASLKLLAEVDNNVTSDISQVFEIWHSSNLNNVRNKYFAHNDLGRSLNESHRVNVPLDEMDIAAIKRLVAALRDFRQKVHRKLRNRPYLDDVLDKEIECEIKVLDRCLMEGELFFKLLPEHEE